MTWHNSALIVVQQSFSHLASDQRYKLISHVNISLVSLHLILLICKHWEVKGFLRNSGLLITLNFIY